MKKLAIILSIAILTVLVSYSGYYWYQTGLEKRASEAQIAAKNTLINDTEKQIGGEIIRDGYVITYESGKQRFIITVTNEPFEENKAKALSYLESIGIKTCDLNYLVLPGRGVTPGADSGATPINTCGL